MKNLLIVESPAKAKTIEKILGKEYIVMASFGHIRDLEKKSLGIDIENQFHPKYKIIAERKKQIDDINNLLKKNQIDRVYLAADEDREGEAIAWHCAVVFKLNINEKNRIVFHEITREALQKAVQNPRQIQMDMVMSQQARRIIDRLIGFELSPLLWKFVGPKLSAGRVQSVCLKIIIDKENEIEKHSSTSYYRTYGYFENGLQSILDKSFDTKEDVYSFLESSKDAVYKINDIKNEKVEKKPPAPYITSTIQQDIGSRYGISSKNAMSILQKLYENGHITYHRTDSTILCEESKKSMKEYILNHYGKEYLQVRNFKTKSKNAQEAHEALRPTNILKTEIEMDPIENKIYQLIWKRTVASQMSASEWNKNTIQIGISNREEMFVSKIETLLFEGYRKVYQEFKEENKGDEDDILVQRDMNQNRVFHKDQIVIREKIESHEKMKNPPPRYNESSMIKKMEKESIGRPSTYASTIDTILSRKYVEVLNKKGTKKNVCIITLLNSLHIEEKEKEIEIGEEKKKLFSTEMGRKTSTFLQMHFESIFHTEFTKEMEDSLDKIIVDNDNNKKEWVDVVQSFYEIFHPMVGKLKEEKTCRHSETDSNLNSKRELGEMDEFVISVYHGQYGPVIEKKYKRNMRKKPIFVKIPDSYSIDTIQLDDVSIIESNRGSNGSTSSTLSNDVVMGEYENETIYLKKGRYGHYILYHNKNYTLPAEYVENPTNLKLEDIYPIIQSNRKIGDYEIKNGKYGNYFVFHKKNYKIPKNYNIKTLTEVDCKSIIDNHKEFIKK